MPHTTEGRQKKTQNNCVCACVHKYMCSQHKNIDIYIGLLSNICLPNFNERWVKNYSFNGKAVKYTVRDVNMI